MLCSNTHDKVLADMAECWSNSIKNGVNSHKYVEDTLNIANFCSFLWKYLEYSNKRHNFAVVIQPIFKNSVR